MTHGNGSGERRVLERSERRENVDQVFEDYLSSVADELRLPLRSLIKLTRLLGEHEGHLNAGTREYVDYIRASAEHMSVMLNKLRRLPAPGRGL